MGIVIKETKKAERELTIGDLSVGDCFVDSDGDCGFVVQNRHHEPREDCKAVVFIAKNNCKYRYYELRNYYAVKSRGDFEVTYIERREG